MTKQADLGEYIFAGQPHLLSGELLRWMESSTRFTTFVETYRDKIRKKVRLTSKAESTLDLRSELEIAYCLLKDRRLEITYEPYASKKGRSPDFAVTYRTNLTFNIEVSRLRVDKSEGIDLLAKEERILGILLEKLGQMMPGMANLLIIHAQEKPLQAFDLGRLMKAVKTRADRKDASFYALSRYSNPAAFYKDYLRLNGILLWGPESQLWVNSQARVSLAKDVLRLVGSLQGTDTLT